MLNKIEIYKRATLVRFNCEFAKNETTPVKEQSSNSERSSGTQFGFTDEDVESESTKSSEISNVKSPEDSNRKKLKLLKEIVFS